jgi:hypothetical protein
MFSIFLFSLLENNFIVVNAIGYGFLPEKSIMKTQNIEGWQDAG